MNIDQLQLEGKKALIRVDFNVPLDQDQNIKDDTRIRAAIPTIKFVLKNGGATILMSHLGRPGKDVNEDGSIKREKYSLRHIVDRLAELSDAPVHFIDDTVGESVLEAANSLKAGEILLLENTRFYPEEKAGDEAFAKQLSELADVYVNDAFGTAHRAHASTATVASYFKKGEKAFGFLMGQEIGNAGRLLSDPQRPFVAILGGAKVSDKISLIENLLDKVDDIIIGGGMAYTFFKAMDGKVGNSLVEEDHLLTARSIMGKAEMHKVNIHLPLDSVIANRFAVVADHKIAESNQIPDGWMGLDIGPNARKSFASVISGAKSIIWNGPMGVFEMEPFANGTLEVARAVAGATDMGAFSLVGGGDSVSAVNQSGVADRISFISTGGGAMLTLLEGQELPGVKAIND
jgi:phosphoglycerate kinase